MESNPTPETSSPSKHTRVWGVVILILSPVFPILYLATAMGVGDSGMFDDLPAAVTALQFIPNLLMLGGLLLTPAFVVIGFVALLLGDRTSPVVFPTLIAMAGMHFASVVYALIPLFFLSSVSDTDQLRIRKFEIELLMPSLVCATVFSVSSYIAWTQTKRRPSEIEAGIAPGNNE